MTSGQISSELDLTYAPSTITKQQPTEGELDLLFEALYDDYFGGQPLATVETVSPAPEPHVRQTSTASTTIADNVPIPTNSSSHATNILITSQDVDKLNPNAMVDGNTFVNPFATSSSNSAETSSSQNVDPSNMHTFYQPYPHEFQWTKDHPLKQVIGEPSQPVLTRNQLRSDANVENVPTIQEPQVRQTSTASTSSTDNVPIPTNSSSLATNNPIPSQDVDELNLNAMVDGNTFVNPFANPSTSAAQASSSSQNVDPSNMYTFYQPYPYEFQWTKDHPLEQVIGEPSRPVLTRNQLRSDGDMCIYALTVSTMEPKNVKKAMTDPAWIESMQEELLQFKRMDVWVLIPIPDNISPLTLKWIFKNKHDEEQTVIRPHFFPHF
nr:hypothetical protein [Tanacetum cinerariifolium]